MGIANEKCVHGFTEGENCPVDGIVQPYHIGGFKVGQRKPFKPPIKFEVKRGRYWVGFDYSLVRDGWLINLFGIGVFIPSERLRWWRR